MKGIVFAEFLELVEDKFGLEIADEIIEEAELPSGGAYTSVGTYDHNEMVALVTLLSEKTQLSIETLMHVFGEHLLTRFVAGYPQFFENVNSCFDFLDTIENRVHVEVQKLYPEAELPTFETLNKDEQQMQMLYQSKRPFSALAYGLIIGSAHHYGENIDVTMDDRSENNRAEVLFTLTKNA